MSSDTPRTDAIKKLIRDAINEPDRERQIAMREGAECGIEQLERDLAAANERAERAEAERDALRADVAEAILILCAQFDTNGGDGIDAWLDELSMPDCEGRFDNIVGAIRAASDAERKP